MTQATPAGTERAPRAAVLDFGGVMAHSPVGRLHWLADRLGCAREVVVSTIFGGHGDGNDNPWYDAERGRCDLDERFGERMAARFAVHGVTTFELDMFVEWVADAVNHPQDEMVDAVRALRAAGIPTALCTNSVREFRPVIERTIPVAELFDVVIDSCEVGHRKPEPEIYRLTAAALALDPTEIVFVDDLIDNVEGARDAGMTTIHLPVDADASEVARRLLATFGLRSGA